jgi:hypothetical protein
MLNRISRHFTSAHAIALLALFVALSGSAYAVKTINGALLKRGSVAGSKLKARAVTSGKLAANAVNGAKIADGAVGGPDLANGAVGTAKLADGAVLTSKLANAVVTSVKLADAAVTPAQLADGAVGTSKLGDAAVTAGKLGANSVDGSKVVDGSIAGSDVTPLSFTQPTLQNGWNTGALTTVPGFGKDATGFVHLRGQILGGTLGTSAFQLPAGLRPAQSASFGALHIAGGSSTVCGVQVGTNGDVTIGIPGDTGCATTAGLYSLDGMTFQAG